MDDKELLIKLQKENKKLRKDLELYNKKCHQNR